MLPALANGLGRNFQHVLVELLFLEAETSARSFDFVSENFTKTLPKLYRKLKIRVRFRDDILCKLLVMKWLSGKPGFGRVGLKLDQNLTKLGHFFCWLTSSHGSWRGLIAMAPPKQVASYK
jgi:hypothetical protein